MTYNTTTINGYINGALNTSIAVASGTAFSINSPGLGIGGSIARITGNQVGWTGYMYYPTIYNRALSSQQILDLYNNQSYLITNSLLQRGQNWTACVTPNDGLQNGATVCSNNLVIAGTAPTAPVLIIPNNGNNTLTNLSVFLLWNSSIDIDGYPLTYNINLTSQFCANQYYSGVSATNYTTTLLSTFDKCGYYNWSVQAFDGSLYSPWSSIFNFSITPYVNINLTQNLSDFGNMGPLQSNTTINNSPPPFVVQSNSNVLVNVTVSATPLFSTSGLGNKSFEFKANTSYMGNSSFNFQNSTTVWTPMGSTAQLVIAQLNYPPFNNTAGIDLNVTVPQAEPPGQKISTITVFGAES
jgi:hypothetical protein